MPYMYVDLYRWPFAFLISRFYFGIATQKSLSKYSNTEMHETLYRGILLRRTTPTRQAADKSFSFILQSLRNVMLLMFFDKFSVVSRPV